LESVQVLRKFGKYPEDKKKKPPAEFIRPEKPGEKFSIDTGTRYMGDKTQVRFQPIYDDFNSELVVLIGGYNCDHDLTLKALNELRQMYPNIIIQIRSDGGKEFDNKDVITFFENNKITWKKISKPYDNPFAERGIRTLKHEYFDQIWIGNFDEFEKIISIVKSHYNESRPHQSFENKTPLEVRMEATDNKKNYSPPQEMEKWDTLCRTILKRTNTAIC
jgi:transposase InsO family protein